MLPVMLATFLPHQTGKWFAFNRQEIWNHPVRVRHDHDDDDDNENDGVMCSKVQTDALATFI